MSRGTAFGFELKPDLLHHSVGELQTAQELLELQELFSGKLDIFLRKDGGFLIIISTLVPLEDKNDVLCELCESFNLTPTLLNLGKLI